MSSVQGQQGDTGEPDVRRAEHLEQIGRTEDALSAYRAALAIDPKNADLLRRFAHCQMRSEKEAEHALGTIDQAVALVPNDPYNHVVRSLVLADQRKPKLAVAAAEEAIALEPELSIGHTALANAYLKRQSWHAAEVSAKKALSLDPDEEMSANILAHALFCQGKQVENQVHISGLLHQDPEDPYTHYVAGLAALQAEKYQKAEEHFLEALRLNPNFDAAREGLLNTFRARSFVYRSYLRYAFFMTRLTSGQRYGLIIGLLLAVQLLKGAFRNVSPGISTGIGVVYMLFVLWTFVARSVGSLIVLGDHKARRALRFMERLDAVVVGGGVVVGLVLLLAGFVLGQSPLIALGGGCICMAVPVVMALTNEHPKGKFLYGLLGLINVIALSAMVVGLVVPGLDLMDSARTAGFLTLIVTTWLAVFGVLYRN
ncbi:tetratricopeptide repeat protein [Verrucomicrobiales bacterium]|jgi:tetratricopeptide (TPR) repeat protein|nr:tetratricopeptide repeat protein [Verrucomicrobiales bacterium]MDB4527129.1 tetratricopeptide repeat protein [bacterium]MDF1787147.1 tetratricopeptide repeat protein [Verrucomicrobiales bacterium]